MLFCHSGRSRWRVYLLTILMSTGFAGGATHAQSDLGAIASKSQPGTMLNEYLQQKARDLLEQRRKTIESLNTADDVTRRQREIRGKFLESLGPFPDRTPLNGQVLGKDQREGYRVEKVVFESRPGHHVTAALYLPDGGSTPPYPGVLVPCGHSINGKAAEAYQRISILLAKNGLASLCYDPIGQGERSQLLTSEGKPALPGSTTEHTMVGVGALLVGRQAAHYRIWDGLRAMDYLASRPDIDPQRLGCTGNSGGGTMTAYLMALDERIAVAAPSCYTTTLERLFATIGPQDAEQNITGQVAFGMDHADYITLRAPRPTLLCVGTRDYFDIEGAWTSFREAKRVYGMLGHGERVEIFEYNDTHGFSQPRREAAMRWMRRWLLNHDDAPVETAFPVATDAQLQVTKTGQVLLEFAGERTAFDFNADEARRLDQQRAAKLSHRTSEQLRQEVSHRLGLPEQAPNVIVQKQAPEVRDGYTIDKWTLLTEPGISVATRLYRPTSKVSDSPIVVYVGADQALAAAGGPIEQRVRSGESVAMVDPRGMGETTPVAPGKTGYGRGPFGPDEREAFLALHLNRPLLGQRVFDLRQALRALDGGRGFHLIGVGLGGPVALHAATLDSQIKRLELGASLLSWTDAAQAKTTKNLLSSVIPGVLAAYDLPDLAAAFAPRPLVIRDPIDPAGLPLALDRAEVILAPAVAAYQKENARDQLRVTTQP